ncbi:kelch motif family protein [Stylonychia lemnae]|uniref:Kelch motif family protein n=1 Tax=Stylonychia lemnae TaxID=5949 RepID=A0A077ZP88_STYLE|nr:kelch motif family protein [Stylonychia lemnae]|eukprot:CDW71274.1 kelch motif family protein [Stylonychia lemnae]
MEKEECSICFFQYDKHHKVPRILRCGHTFCQTCLDEIKLPSKHSITCPNCRLQTENVICTKNLPENDGVFNPSLRVIGVNLNSPYESAKRLMQECEALQSTSSKFMQYINKLEQLDNESEKIIMDNFEKEYQKVEGVAQIMIQMINDYKDKLQKQLTDSMVVERNKLNQHIKEINLKRIEITDIKSGVEEVAIELSSIKENEQEYLRLQKEYYRRMQELEEEQNQMQELTQKGQVEKMKKGCGSDSGSSCGIGGMNSTANEKQMIKIQNEKIISSDFCVGMNISTPPVSQQDLKLIGGQSLNNNLGKDLLIEIDSDTCSQKSDTDLGKISMQNLCNNSSSNSSLMISDIKNIEAGEVESLEKEDKIRVNQVRTQFYSINERFEQLLKFKSVSKIQLWQTELNLNQTYNIFATFKLEEKFYSTEDKIKELEAQMDLKDYYDIKRPIVVFFYQQNKQLRATKIDLLCDQVTQTNVKLVNPMISQTLNLRNCKTVTHPSNNSVYIVDDAQLYQYDNNNDLILQKQMFNQLKGTVQHALAYNEGFIYLVGGYDSKTHKTLKQCSRFNIITEKWQQMAPMLFEIKEASACAINESQIVVAGGVNSQQRLSEIVQIYDIRENAWKLFEICLSTPRKQVTMVSSHMDRVIIIGGKEYDENSESKIVEEIDFLKRNIVNLAPLRVARSNSNAFMVNDSIYAFGGNSLASMIGEKYTLSENKWREVKPKDPNENLQNCRIIGGAALLYE